MKNKLLKLLFFIMIITIITIPSINYADDDAIYKQPSKNTADSTSGQSLNDMITDADSFVNQSDSDAKVDIGKLQDFSSVIYGMLLQVAVIVSVGVGLFIGIQFMVGSVEQKANVKELLVPYLVGCVIVYGSLGIWKLVLTILQQI